jgi:hypothetical protein
MPVTKDKTARHAKRLTPKDVWAAIDSLVEQHKETEKALDNTAWFLRH